MKALSTLAAVLCCACPSFALPPGAIVEESLVPAYTLPDPLVFTDGTQVTSSGQWNTKRRPELLRLFESEIYGRTLVGRPDALRFVVREEKKDDRGGKATRLRIGVLFEGREDGRQMELLVYLPNHAAHPVQVFLGLNFDGNYTITDDADLPVPKHFAMGLFANKLKDNVPTEAGRGIHRDMWQVDLALQAGYGIATAAYGEIEPDADGHWRDGPRGLSHEPGPGDWGCVGAWAWGLSRAMDYLETDPRVDGKRVTVIGFSRLGKAAMWAGAQDLRFNMVISNASGAGGIALNKRIFGETVKDLTTRLGRWFTPTFAKYAGNEAALPVDAHELVALIAPRPLLATSGTEDLWSDPHGEFLSLVAADPVYRLLTNQGINTKEWPKAGTLINDRVGYFLRQGGHNVTVEDWRAMLTFAGRHANGSSASLIITSPSLMQVVQRRSKGEGVVKLTGSVGKNVSEVRYRISTMANEWKPLPVADNAFSTTIPLPAAGWYRLEMKAFAGDKEVAEANVDQFGVGEVFIVAGQSNAGNYGSEKQVTHSGLVMEFDGKQWNPADDPQQGGGGNGGSFMPAFGDALAKRFGVPIGLIPVAAGGTSVREWLPKGIHFKQNTTTGRGTTPVEDGYESKGILFDKLTKPMKALGIGGFRAVLWHQGESDAGQVRGGAPVDRQISGGQYVEFMEQVIRRSRNAAGWPVPWFTAVTTYHNEKDPGDDEFRTAMQSLWSKGLSWPGPDMDTLRADLRTGVHFNGKGLQKHGELWAEKVGPWVESLVAAPREGPPSKDYKMIWNDEFDGPELDKAKWAHRSVGERRGAWIDPECVSFDGKGHMLISVKKVGDQYHGGMIGTEKKQSWTYGYFECRVQVATEAGMNTAFWMQAPRMSAPDQGKGVVDDTEHNGTELDILEYIARQGDVAHFNLHWNGYGKLHKSAPADGWLPDLRQGFHVYGMEWTPEGYTFYLDGRPYWHTTEAISKTEEYIILDLEVSAWAGGINKANLPANAIFDWVRVWQK